MPDAYACQGEVGSDLISWEKFKALVAKKPKAPEKQARFSARGSFAHTFSHQHVFYFLGVMVVLGCASLYRLCRLYRAFFCGDKSPD